MEWRKRRPRFTDSCLLCLWTFQLSFLLYSTAFNYLPAPSLSHNHHSCLDNQRRSGKVTELCVLQLHDMSPTTKSKDQKSPPLPAMPSSLFQKMASSQLEILANSLSFSDGTKSKAESMALYLPQENAQTGQLEFTPAVLYPDPNAERVFIASDADSGQAPTLPKTLTRLPGSAHANTLLPGYPMMSTSDSNNPGVGVVEEVVCDVRFKNGAPALSVPLLSGSRTVGVLLVSPSMVQEEQIWTERDRDQVSRAAQSLSMALSMERQRAFLEKQNTSFRENLSDSLHQVKNPLQAIRTYGKILQTQIAHSSETSSGRTVGATSKLLELADRLMVQSERAIHLMAPMDSLVESIEYPLLNPAKNVEPKQYLLLRAADVANHHRSTNSNSTLKHEQRDQRKQEVLTFGRHMSKNKERPTASPPRSFTNATVWTTKTEAREALSAPSYTVVGDLKVEMTFVPDVLEPIVSAFRAIALEKHIAFEFIEESTELPGVLAAPQSLQEAFSNVLDNAFKYVALPKTGSLFLRNPSPSVKVRVFANEYPSGVTVLVEDNGPGIAEDDQPNIFSRGFRSERTNAVAGSGIGLDISLSLISRMGGALDFVKPDESDDSLDGAVFRFTLFRQPQ